MKRNINDLYLFTKSTKSRWIIKSDSGNMFEWDFQNFEHSVADQGGGRDELVATRNLFLKFSENHTKFS